MIEGLIAGALAGTAYGLLGYARNRDIEDFDWNYLMPTIFGSAIIGAYAQYSNLNIDIVSSSAIGVLVTQMARKLWNLVIEYYNSKTNKE